MLETLIYVFIIGLVVGLIKLGWEKLNTMGHSAPVGQATDNSNEGVIVQLGSNFRRSNLICYEDKLIITVKNKTSTIPLSDLRTIFHNISDNNGKIEHEIKFCPALDDDVDFALSGSSQNLSIEALYNYISKLNPEVEIHFEDRTGQFGSLFSEQVKLK